MTKMITKKTVKNNFIFKTILNTLSAIKDNGVFIFCYMFFSIFFLTYILSSLFALAYASTMPLLLLPLPIAVMALHILITMESMTRYSPLTYIVCKIADVIDFIVNKIFPSKNNSDTKQNQNPSLVQPFRFTHPARSVGDSNSAKLTPEQIRAARRVRICSEVEVISPDGEREKARP